jgi:hypothetical protein
MTITHQSTYIRPSSGQVSNLGLGNFVSQINLFNAKAINNLDKAIRKMVFEVFKRIVMRTPVDTSRCRSAWAVGLTPSNSSPIQSSTKLKTTWKKVSRATPKGKRTTTGYWEGKTTETVKTSGIFESASGTINRGRQFIQSGMDIHDGLIAYIFNNVRYAIYLEGGRVYPSPPYGSPQAPRGMVRITLAEFGSISSEAVTSVQSGGLKENLGA